MNRTRNTDHELPVAHGGVGRRASERTTPPLVFATAPTTVTECELLMCNDKMSEEGNETNGDSSGGRVQGCDKGTEVIILCDGGASPSRRSCVPVRQSGMIWIQFS